MKKKYLIILLTLITLSNPLRAQVLNAVAVEQEQDQWCWSGSSACILEYYCTPTPQCTIAEYTRTVATWHNFGSVNCCTNPNVGCNYWNYNWGYAGSIQDILVHFAGIQNSGYGSYLSASSVQSQVAANRPFVIRWGWNTGGGHFLVGHGLVNQDLYYMDPWFGEGLKIATYSWVVSGSNHTWTHTNIINTSSPRPYPASSVAGPQSVVTGQQGITYSTGTITNATSYLWQLSPTTVGVIISNGTTGTLNLNSTFTGTFTITVSGQNSCGVGSVSAPLPVTVNPVPLKTLNLKAYLEGLYLGASTMREAFDENGPHFGVGIADQVTVELHNAANYSTIEYTSGLVNLSTTGNITISTIPGNYSGSYYITIRHRNSIETTSSMPVSFTGSLISYDFSTDASQAYGDNQKEISGDWSIWSGDVNQDGIVDSGDMNPVDNASTLITFGYVDEDVNGDGIVDGEDMNMVDNYSTAIIVALIP